VLEFAPQSIYLTGLVVGLLAVIALLGLAFFGRGRGGVAAPEHAPRAHRWLAVGAVFVGLVVGGLPGGIAAAAGALLAWVVLRPAVAGALACAAALGSAVTPWPGSLDAPEALLVATALLAIAALGAAASPGRTPQEYAGAPTPGSVAQG
jgi:hypothetical protein